MIKILFAAVLIAALVPLTAGQDSRLPQASLDRELGHQMPGSTPGLSNLRHRAVTPPSYCKPCLFYAGDFDSLASDANGLANEFDTTVSTGAAVYVPFIVPRGKTWTVTGLFTDNFLAIEILDPATSPYEIRKGIPAAGGNGGKLVCHGKKQATLTPVGQNYFGVYVYATKVEHIKGCSLHTGKYWMSVVPYCMNASKCNAFGDYRGWEANDDGAMAHRFGPLEPANNSFFNSVYFGAVWQPSSEQQSSSRFSDGVEGTSR
jgi:hypothetical protein